MIANSEHMKISVIGCGKLGAPLVACLANSGHEVVGIDLDEKLIENLSNLTVPWNEPDLQDMLKENQERISFSTKYEGNISNSSVSFIIVPTPSEPDGSFSNRFVLNAIERIGSELKSNANSMHLIVIVSTVMPGSTSGIIKSTLADAVGGASEGIKICYSPEFIALGSVIKNMQYPDIILIGEDEPGSGTLLESISRSIAKNNPRVLTLTTREAEVTKIAINSYVTTKISFSNQISEICEKTEGASAENVLTAIGSDSRIGNSYLKAGTAFGGPCFPRDNRAFAAYSSSLGLVSDLALATDEINSRQAERLLVSIKKILGNKRKICVVGLSYKPDTDVTEESPAVKFLLMARKEGFQVFAIDSNVRIIPELEDLQIFTMETLSEVPNEIDAYILFVPSREYIEVPNLNSRNKIIIDLWGSWDKFKANYGENYFRLGNYDGR